MNSKIIVTGGAGFIGSNLVKALLSNDLEVHVFDNLSSGRKSNIPIKNPNLFFHHIDLKSDLNDWPVVSAKKLFHFAANADVKGGLKNYNIDFHENICVTKSVCDYCRKHKIEHVTFASSATVYGEPKVFPTPEDCSLKQTSLYGASKLSSEAMIQAYSEYGIFSSCIFRFVSWTGAGYSHGVIYDFVKKLLKNNKELLILGDGNQTKSYLDVKDGISGVLGLSEKVNKNSKIFNLGHNETMNVIDLANIICNQMNLKDVHFKFTGGEKGWIGDSPLVHLDTTLAKSFGWYPRIGIEQSIRGTVDYLLSSPDKFFRD
tara:strand:+ start:17815 stop:18765 length:951 start_codon:yes stop_codon:yes gene_type:complete